MKPVKKLILVGLSLWAGFGSLGTTAATPRVLVVLSASPVVSTQEGGKHPTGYFMSELALPVIALKRAGYEIVYATPQGVVPVMDAASDNPKWFASPAAHEGARRLLGSEPGLKKTRRLADLDARELSTFEGVFVPGGHAPLEDLAHDENLARILQSFHDLGKPTGLLCHGPAALLSARVLPGRWIYSGYRMTAFSTAEEKESEAKGRLGGHVLYYVENELSKLGGLLNVGKPWTSQVVRDRELITGQNPMSEQAFTSLFLEALTEYRRKGTRPRAGGAPR